MKRFLMILLIFAGMFFVFSKTVLHAGAFEEVFGLKTEDVSVSPFAMSLARNLLKKNIIKIDETKYTSQQNKTYVERRADDVASGFKFLFNGATGAVFYVTNGIVTGATAVVHISTDGLVSCVEDLVGDDVHSTSNDIRRWVNSVDALLRTPLNIGKDTTMATGSLVERMTEVVGQTFSGKLNEAARNAGGAFLNAPIQIVGSVTDNTTVAVVEADRVISKSVSGTSKLTSGITDVMFQGLLNGVTALSTDENTPAEVLAMSDLVGKVGPDLMSMAGDIIADVLSDAVELLGKATGSSLSIAGNFLDAGVRNQEQEMLMDFLASVYEISKKIDDDIVDFTEDTLKETISIEKQMEETLRVQVANELGLEVSGDMSDILRAVVDNLGENESRAYLIDKIGSLTQAYKGRTSQFVKNEEEKVISKLMQYMNELKNIASASNSRARKGTYNEEVEAFWIEICSAFDMERRSGCKGFKKLWQAQHCSSDRKTRCESIKSMTRMINADRTCGRGKRILTTQKMEKDYDKSQTYERFCCTLDWDFSEKAFIDFFKKMLKE